MRLHMASQVLLNGPTSTCYMATRSERIQRENMRTVSRKSGFNTDDQIRSIASRKRTSKTTYGSSWAASAHDRSCSKDHSQSCSLLSVPSARLYVRPANCLPL